MRRLIAALLWCGLSVAIFGAHSAPLSPAAQKPTKQAIVGAWRLVSIDYSGPNGALADPVFGPNPQGIIIYEQSGWMSVQIATANRPEMAKPATRTSGVVTAGDASVATGAFNTYYAYFGTWEYDADTSVITHHLTSSLLPYETGLDYRRELMFDGANLTLVGRSQESGEERRRTVVWTRISAPRPAAEPSAPPPTGIETTKYGDMPADYEEAIRTYFRAHLKYPDTVQYREITKPERGYIMKVTGTLLMREIREYGWTVKATINAKNSKDGYVGFKTYTLLFRDEKIVDTRLPLPGDEMSDRLK